MRKICLFLTYDKYHGKNAIFDSTPKEKSTGRPFLILSERLRDLGFEIATDDVLAPEDSDIIIYLSLPRNGVPARDKPQILMRFESELIHPWEWNKEKLKNLDAILTWHDNEIDNKKYFKFNFPQEIKTKELDSFYSDVPSRFCTMISANKTSKHHLELYSQRVQTALWFEKNHPSEFDLYGHGWDEGLEKSGARFAAKIVRRLGLSTAPLKQYFRSYAGPVENKLITLSQYKFCICYENARDIPGYITEKIFDCFAAGSIPIYWGAPNIQDYIPKSCFIDRREFQSHNDLYAFLRSITEDNYVGYRQAMYDFVKGSLIAPFLGTQFSQDVITAIAYVEKRCST